MLPDQNHPERREGEIFLGNVGEDTFLTCVWQTKRRGNTAYDTDGKPLQHGLLWPMFIRQSEWDAAKIPGTA